MQKTEINNKPIEWLQKTSQKNSNKKLQIKKSVSILRTKKIFKLISKLTNKSKIALTSLSKKIIGNNVMANPHDNLILREAFFKYARSLSPKWKIDIKSKIIKPRAGL